MWWTRMRKDPCISVILSALCWPKSNTSTYNGPGFPILLTGLEGTGMGAFVPRSAFSM